MDEIIAILSILGLHLKPRTLNQLALVAEAIQAQFFQANRLFVH